jgi:biopolymer transport protein ExbD
MAKSMRAYMDKRVAATFKVQITSMVDMFVIILVFLLKSYTTSPVDIPPTADLRLPTSSSYDDPVDVVKMAVTKKGIFVDDKVVVEFGPDGRMPASVMDAKDPQFIQPLFKALDDQAQKTKDIAKKNETVEFDGRILVQADKDVQYALLQKVMYTSMLAGYADLKLAVASRDF